MKLVYNENLEQVRVGDKGTLLDGSEYTITDIRKPHSPASTGRVFLRDAEGLDHGFYPSVINATWVDREDRNRTKIKVKQDGTSFLSLIEDINTDRKYRLLAEVRRATTTEEARQWFIATYCRLNGYEPEFVDGE